MTEPQPLSDLLDGVLARIGAGDLGLWRRLEEEWAEVAGPPWDRHSRPLSLRAGLLVVEAASPAAISLLRYGVSSLRRSLEARLGEGVVTEVRIRPPERR